MDEEELRRNGRAAAGPRQGRALVGLDGHVPQGNLAKAGRKGEKVSALWALAHALRQGPKHGPSRIRTWSSSPETAMTEASVGCHSTEVMGLVCHLKVAQASGLPLSRGWDKAG